MIYDTKASQTPLNKEIEYINNFIQLQHIRYPDPDSISISLPHDCADIQVAPMLFIPFIENAFKYSVSSGKMPLIAISITCNKQTLEFNCRNYVKSDGVETGRPGGVGLENVKRRLELLYPNKYKLTISKEAHTYSVNLIIQLL
jgi:sensor histidine kinase YesM